MKSKFTSPQRSGGGPPLTIFIANMAEDVWQYLDTLPLTQKAVDIRGCDLTSDRELSAFLDTSNLLLITPIKVDPLFTHYMQKLKPLPRRQAGKTLLEILVPKAKTGRISLDVLHDQKIIQQIIDLGKKYTIRLESYTASREFIGLVDFLQTQNPAITAPLTPDRKNQSVVDYFGSKSGLRQFYDRHKTECDDFVMSQGKIFTNKAEAFVYAQNLLDLGLGVVFKTPKGHSGIGVVIVKPASPSIDFDSLLTEPYWDQFPLIVEEYIPINHAVGGGTPNAEYLIDQDGRTQLLYVCGMRMDESGYFQGMEIGPLVLPQPIVAKLIDLGNFLGDQYARKGYRGYFDIDGMIDKKGGLLISESNVRRTGGTHVFRLAQTLLGDDFPHHHYLLSNNYYPLPQGKWTLSKILRTLKPILLSTDKNRIGQPAPLLRGNPATAGYDPKSKSGLIITGALTLQDNFLSYAILAKNRPTALDLENQMKALLRS